VAVEPDSREKNSESRMTVAKSAIVPAAITSWPNVEPISPASLRTGTSTPSEVAESTIAMNSGCEARPPAFSSSPTTMAIASDSAKPVDASRSTRPRNLSNSISSPARNSR